MGNREVVLIAGPTASGKSSLAIEMARTSGGVIVNADSMQVYDVLRVLTARPGPEDLAAAPHRLFGHVDPARPYSTGQWVADVERVIGDPEIAGRPLVFTGGTGLYFRALLTGLSPMPDIPDAVRQRWRYRLHEEGAQKLHRVLRQADPEAAMTLRPSDGQRIVRALEVMETSGRSILSWQGETGRPLVDPDTARRFVIMPDRERLCDTIERRLDRMVEDGALDEVRDLLARGVDAEMPAMKAIGVREFAPVLDDMSRLDEALVLAKTATRQYAKRQMTWFRNQLDETWIRLNGPDTVDTSQ
jgi:tRNA dimethylallyltransferase